MSNKMTAEKLYEMLKKIQEPRGFYFNKDMSITLPLLESLLINKEEYGYMACPCRLPNGDFDADRDIVCPCEYRDPDLEEFGVCYCGLYVTEEYNQEEHGEVAIPERRPPEKILV